MTQPIRFGALFGLAAASAMAASPALAADLSQPSAPAPSPAQIGFVPSAWKAETAGHHRYRRWHHRRNRIDAGDVIVGALVIGGIAAIASSASKNERERRRERERDYDRRYDERRYDERRNTRSSGSRGLDNAVDQCVERVERDVRIESVDGVDRTGEGWLVTGSLFNGEGFSCRINNSGRIDSIDYGGFSGASATDVGNQWSDADYFQARQAINGNVSAPQPAYPGGPLPGEEIDGDLGG